MNAVCVFQRGALTAIRAMQLVRAPCVLQLLYSHLRSEAAEPRGHDLVGATEQ